MRDNKSVNSDNRRRLLPSVAIGYRVYYTERKGVLILLLAGGNKSTQQKDIRMAIALAKGLKE